MIIKSIVQVGNPIIRRKSKRVENFYSPQVKGIIKNLTDTLRHANLVGMAAPQIGHNLRIFLTELRGTTLRKTNKIDKLRVFINPKILRVSKKMISGYEGCGSVASSQIFGKVPRAAKITVEAFDIRGQKFILTATGLLARIIQHENDHLDGIIFLDRVLDKKSLMSREEYIKNG